MAVIGIDLGTTNSAAVVFRNGKAELIKNSFGSVLTPSVVGIDDNGEILVGQAAKERLISHPGLTAASFKRQMGSDTIINLNGRKLKPEELSSFVLRKLKEDAERYLLEEVTEAVISVPAYFNDDQRYATKAAAELAGLHTERLVNEPSAAALASRLNSMEEDASYLVFDFGGGTLDVSVVDCFENVIEIVAVAGDNRLGGNDFDLLITEEFCKKNGITLERLSQIKRASLMKRAEELKQALTSIEEAEMTYEHEGRLLHMCMSRDELLELSASLFVKMKAVINRTLLDSKKRLSDISHILLVGGSCKMPVVQGYLSYLSGRDIKEFEEPETLVAKGLGVYTGIKQRNVEIKDIMMTDVCPFTLGIAVKNDESDQRAHMAAMISRNSVLPAFKKDIFYTLHDGQEEVRLMVYQGEGYFVSENLYLGEVILSVPKKPKGEEGIEVAFTYDINGILEMEAINHSSGNKISKVIVGRNSKLSEEEIESKKKELMELRLASVKNEEFRYLTAKGQRLYAEASNEYKSMLGNCLSLLEEAIVSNSPNQMHRAKKYAAEVYERVEAALHEDQTGLGFKMYFDWQD